MLFRSSYARKHQCHPEILNETTVYVEFHSWSLRRFWQDLWPARDALAARHQQSGGFFASIVLIRDPIAHIMSHALMWPPREASVTGKRLPLWQWLGGQTASYKPAYGLQTRELVFAHFNNCSTAATNLALARLRAFSIACNLRWIARCVGIVAKALGWAAGDGKQATPAPDGQVRLADIHPRPSPSHADREAMNQARHAHGFAHVAHMRLRAIAHAVSRDCTRSDQ